MPADSFHTVSPLPEGHRQHGRPVMTLTLRSLHRHNEFATVLSTTQDPDGSTSEVEQVINEQRLVLLRLFNTLESNIDRSVLPTNSDKFMGKDLGGEIRDLWGEEISTLDATIDYAREEIERLLVRQPQHQ